jgi:hypothetical protein
VEKVHHEIQQGTYARNQFSDTGACEGIKKSDFESAFAENDVEAIHHCHDRR